VIALPPLLGAVQLTTADPLPPVADTPVGAPGTVVAPGVTAFDGEDTGPEPAALDGVTVNVYVVPLVSPDTVAEVGAGFPVTVVGVCAADPM